MRKLVLGILALISVQFAFVTYMMVLQSPVELTDATPATQSTFPITERARIDHFTNSPEVVPQPEAAPLPSEPRRTTARSAPAHQIAPERVAALERRQVNVASKPAFKPTPSKADEPVEFENVVISYNRGPKIPDCQTFDTPKTKKRSYIAKASPVIKKPWEWIKTIASKLN